MKPTARILLVLSIFLFQWRAHAVLPAKPNVLLIITDDTGYGDLSVHGHPLLKTPNLDRLHGQSVRFTDFHVSPTCSPTRSALLTGRHEFKNGVTHTILERERLTPKATTLAEVLRDAGYRTGIFGKWHLGDEDDYQPGRRGFQEVFIHGGGGIGQTFPGSCGDAPGNQYFNPVLRHNGVFEKTEGFCTDIFTSKALHWMEGVPADQPFFCYVPYNAAHAPYSCPDADMAPFAGKVPDQTAVFLGMIANIDSNVGRLLDWLDKSGRAENTLVIFMNDNGCDPNGAKVFNAGMRGTKGTPWLGGTRAASLWRWPAAFKPHDCDALTAHIDVFPTLASIAGAKATPSTASQVEGRSLVPLLEDAAAPWPERTLVTHVGRWPRGADIERYKFSHCSIRSGQWHLVWSTPKPDTGKDTGQLFDVKSDPSEAIDVSQAHPEIKERLGKAYEQWWSTVTPMMVNETAQGPDINPFKQVFWKQFGGGPTPAELKRMDPRQPGKL